jgi:secondary thiamine-phosphate synthase enzyme
MEMQDMAEFSLRSSSRSQMIDITMRIQDEVKREKIRDGICVVYVPHTTAGVTINEGADPSVCVDILEALERLIPRDRGYRHMEGNSDSHLKTSLIGSSATLIVENGFLVLGTWQRVFFCEFDGPRTRSVHVRLNPCGD